MPRHPGRISIQSCPIKTWHRGAASGARARRGVWPTPNRRLEPLQRDAQTRRTAVAAYRAPALTRLGCRSGAERDQSAWAYAIRPYNERSRPHFNRTALYIIIRPYKTPTIWRFSARGLPCDASRRLLPPHRQKGQPRPGRSWPPWYHPYWPPLWQGAARSLPDNGWPPRRPTRASRHGSAAGSGANFAARLPPGAPSRRPPVPTRPARGYSLRRSLWYGNYYLQCSRCPYDMYGQSMSTRLCSRRIDTR